MSDAHQEETRAKPQWVKVSAFTTLDAYDAITQIQRRHRRKTARALQLRAVLDAVITAYAKRQGIKAGE